MHSFFLFVIWELPQIHPCLGEKLCRMRGGIFTFYLYWGRSRLCVIYVVSTTLSSMAQDLTHSSFDGEEPVIRTKTICLRVTTVRLHTKRLGTQNGIIHIYRLSSTGRDFGYVCVLFRARQGARDLARHIVYKGTPSSFISARLWVRSG